MTERAVTIPGQTSFAPGQQDIHPLPQNCDTEGFQRVGLKEGRTPFIKPIQGIDQEDASGGIIDITTVSATVMDKLDAHDDMDAYNFRIGVDYELGNGINLFSNTAYIDYQRSTAHDNSSSPIITNVQHRGEIFDMVSQEFRVRSPAGGTFEWEAGGFYQQEDLDIGNYGDRKYQTIVIRANLRQPARSQDAWQDSRWLSGFGNMTFNFMENKASLDVGARYTDIAKTSFIQGYAHTWIYNVNPDSVAVPNGVDVVGDGIIWGTDHDNNCTGPSGGVATCIDRFRLVGTIAPNRAIVDCGNAADPRRRQCGTFGAGYWTHVYNGSSDPRSAAFNLDGTGIRTLPEAWDTISPVALGPAIFGIRNQPGNNMIFNRDYNDSSLDPQVTLRYRPTENLSLYAKWARRYLHLVAAGKPGSLPTGG